MSDLKAHLIHFDDAWDHDFESLMSVLGGISEEEAAWQPPCYRDEPASTGWPAPGSIRWQVTHIAYYKREYAGRLGTASDSSPAATTSFAEDLEQLRSAHDAEREAIAALSKSELTPETARFLSAIIRHDVWHAAQIAVVRRMWRTRSG
ncbi:MAG: DinB family protein [Planctomycetota bacterium]|jgi:uncharacterized damage-inducible protein DinB